MRIIARGIIIHKKHILLIKRIKNEKEYYVFPGGKPEEKESKEITCIREVKEETGLDVTPEKVIMTMNESPNAKSVFVKCSLEPKFKDTLPELQVLGDEISKSTKRDFFKPLWIPVERVESLTIYPKIVIEKLNLY